MIEVNDDWKVVGAIHGNIFIIYLIDKEKNIIPIIYDKKASNTINEEPLKWQTLPFVNAQIKAVTSKNWILRLLPVNTIYIIPLAFVEQIRSTINELNRSIVHPITSGSIKEQDKEQDKEDDETWFYLSEKTRSSSVQIYIPGKIDSFLDTENITNACGDFMEALGFELEVEDEPIFRSFWKRLQFLFKKHINQDEFDELFTKGKKALELKYVNLPTAEQTEKLASAAEKVINSLDKFPKGVVRLGALLVLKNIIDGEPRILIHHLTYDQIEEFEQKPMLMQDLDACYEIIFKAKLKTPEIGA